MRLIAFAARCQRVDIRTQYIKYGVRCFDLRIRFDEKGIPIVAHGIVEYSKFDEFTMEDLRWIDSKGDCCVRMIHEARTKEQYGHNADRFEFVSKIVLELFQHTGFWCGRNLYNWQKDFDFSEDPSCEETYGSVIEGKKWLYGWWPWLYAVTHNKRIKAKGTDKDILLIDYVAVG
jgi:hypothetical protein